MPSRSIHPTEEEEKNMDVAFCQWMDTGWDAVKDAELNYHPRARRPHTSCRLSQVDLGAWGHTIYSPSP